MTRWYLKREGPDICLVVERRDDRRGYMYRFREVKWDSVAEMRRELRASLPELRRSVARIGQQKPVRVYDPVASFIDGQSLPVAVLDAVAHA